MEVIGVLVMVVGLFLNVYAGAIHRNGRKSVQQHSLKDQDEFMGLLSSGLKILRIVGIVMLLAGLLVVIVF